MSVPFDIRIDTAGTLERVRRQMAAMPAGVARAQQRALRKLSTWVNRQVLREASAAAGVPQKTIKTLLRYRSTTTPDGIRIWIGTNPIKAHHLGTVKWTRKMAGARAGRRGFPGTWSWSTGDTAGVIMRRTGAFGRDPGWRPAARRDLAPNSRLEKIDAETVPVHDPVYDRIEQLQSVAEARFLTLLQQELNYALNVEAARA